MKRNLFDGFGIEHLERRRMLAGNVQVRVSGGDLIVNGDGEDNQILIYQEEDGGVFIRGLGGTAIQEGSTTTDELMVDGLTDDVRINLRNGNNTVIIHELNVADDLSVRTGGGRDRVVLTDLRVTDDISVSSGGGNDDLWLARNLADKTTIRAGSGNDLVSMLFSHASRQSIAAGAGNDELILLGSGGDNALSVRAGGGDDFVYATNFSDVKLNGGGGFDTVNQQSPQDTRSFESDALQAALAVFVADFETGNSFQVHHLDESTEAGTGSVTVSGLSATAGVENGNPFVNVSHDGSGIILAIASTVDTYDRGVVAFGV